MARITLGVAAASKKAKMEASGFCTISLLVPYLLLIGCLLSPFVGFFVLFLGGSSLAVNLQ